MINNARKFTPHGWQSHKLGELLLKKPDYGINAPSVDFSDALPAYIRITDISEDGKKLYGFNYDDGYYIVELEINNRKINKIIKINENNFLNAKNFYKNYLKYLQLVSENKLIFFYCGDSNPSYLLWLLGANG